MDPLPQLLGGHGGRRQPQQLAQTGRQLDDPGTRVQLPRAGLGHPLRLAELAGQQARAPAQPGLPAFGRGQALLRAHGGGHLLHYHHEPLRAAFLDRVQPNAQPPLLPLAQQAPAPFEPFARHPGQDRGEQLGAIGGIEAFQPARAQQAFPRPAGDLGHPAVDMRCGAVVVGQQHPLPRAADDGAQPALAQAQGRRLLEKLGLERETVLVGELLHGGRRHHLGPPRAQQRVHRGEYQLGVRGFDDDVLHPAGTRQPLDLAAFVMRGAESDRDVAGGRLAAQQASQLAAVQAGHQHVGDDRVRRLPPGHVQRALPVFGLPHPVSKMDQQGAQKLTVDRVVVNDQHCCHRADLPRVGAVQRYSIVRAAALSQRVTLAG